MMHLDSSLGGSRYLSLALLFFMLVFLLLILRQIEFRRIEKKFDRKKILALAFGVRFLGLESAPKALFKRSGALVLLKNGLYFQARLSRKELYIRGSAITYLGASDVFKNRTLQHPAVLIGFLNERGKGDIAAFQMQSAPQWITAIKANLLDKKAFRPL